MPPIGAPCRNENGAHSWNLQSKSVGPAKENADFGVKNFLKMQWCRS